MAAAKKPSAHKSLVHNPGGKRPVAKKPAAKANPARKSPVRKATTYRRNPSPGTNAILFTVGGVVAVKAFDIALRQFFPTAAPWISAGAKVAAGFAVSTYLGKALGKWADIAAYGLYFMAAYQALDAWVAPRLPQSLGGTSDVAQITQQQQIKDANTGQLGMRYFLSNGDYVDAFQGAA